MPISFSTSRGIIGISAMVAPLFLGRRAIPLECPCKKIEGFDLNRERRYSRNTPWLPQKLDIKSQYTSNAGRGECDLCGLGTSPLPVSRRESQGFHVPLALLARTTFPTNMNSCSKVIRSAAHNVPYCRLTRTSLKHGS